MSGAFDNPSDPSNRTTSNLRPSQEKALDEALGFITPKIGEGGTPIPFDSIAELPQFLTDAFENFQQSFSDSSEDIRSRLTDLLDPSRTFQADVPGVRDRFTQDILNPAAQAIRDTLGESIFNESNQPGRFFATDTQEKVGRGISQQLGLSTLPLLSQSLENERGREFASREAFLGREPGVVAGLQGLPATEFNQALQATTGFQSAQQNVLNRRAAEFLRVNAAEQDPFLALALGFPGPTAQTLQNTLIPGQPAGQGQQIGLSLLGQFAGQGANIQASPAQQTGRNKAGVAQ